MVSDIFKKIRRTGNDKEVVLTVFFNGGPINVLVDQGKPDSNPLERSRTYTFNADPFFRRSNHYIASRSIAVRPIDTADSLVLVASFTNMFPKNGEPNKKKYHLQLSFTESSSVEESGEIEPEVSQNIVILITA